MRINRVLVMSLAVLSLAGCKKEVLETSSVVETTADEDLNIRIDVEKPMPQGIGIDANGKVTIDETFSFETQSLQEEMETLENGDIMEQARANDESIKASAEESRALAGESLSAEESLAMETISDEEMARLSEEFQSEIDSYNESMYESMMAEWENSQATE